MNPKLLHNLSWIPMGIIGLSAIVLGVRWMVVQEPWLLDKAANEAALGLTFNELFSADINKNLPDYLLIIYRFFGFWVTGIGLLVTAYILVTFMGTSKARNGLLAVLGPFIFGLLYLGHTKIPISPFIPMIYGLLILYCVSLCASVKLNKLEK